jgi:hypothetical protein
VPDRFACADSAQELVLFALSVGRNDQTDGLPDSFLCRVAEHAFGGAVPRRDDTVQILSDNRVVGRGDNRGKSLRTAIRGRDGHGFCVLPEP